MGLAVCAIALGFAVPAVWNVARTKQKLDLPPVARDVDTVRGYRGDLAALRRLPEVDRSFTPATRKTFEAEIDALSARADRLDRAGFEMGVTHAVALAGNGHTNVRGVSLGQSLLALPIRLHWFSDGLYVVAAEEAHADLLGAQVIEEADLPPVELARRLRPYVGGADALARAGSVNFMGAPAALHALGLAPSPRETAFTFRLADGRLERRVVAAMATPYYPALDPSPPSLRDLSPVGLRPGWRHVLTAPPPLWLTRPQTWYWRAWPRPDTLYVQIRTMRNQTGAAPLSDFLATVLRDAETRKPAEIVVDLRASTGGDYTKTWRFSRDLRRTAPKAKIHVLVGPATFSAGVITAARLKAFGGATLVGEPMGDRARFWAEGGRAVLPYSGLKVRYATAWHDWSRGCGLADLGRCYLPNYLGGVAAGDLNPAAPVSLSFADYRAGRDPAFDRAAGDRR